MAVKKVEEKLYHLIYTNDELKASFQSREPRKEDLDGLPLLVYVHTATWQQEMCGPNNTELSYNHTAMVEVTPGETAPCGAGINLEGGGKTVDIAVKYEGPGGPFEQVFNS